MARGTFPIRALYAAYAASMLAIGGVSVLAAVVSGSPSLLGQVLAAGWIVAGIAWILGGFLYAPRVGTYLGPGGGVMLWGAGSPAGISPYVRPESNPEVLADLSDKLSRGTDFATLLAILGVLLLVAGVLASVALWLGGAAGAAILILTLLLMAAATAHPGTPRPA